MTIIETQNAPKAIGPYSQAIVVDTFVYTSGQIPLVPETGQLVTGSVKEQTEQVIKNLKAVLEAAGSSLDKVIKTTCFLTNMADFSVFNAVYETYFINKPARSCVAVSALPKNAMVEIEAVALK